MNERQYVIVDFNSQIASRYHDGIAGCHDCLQVSQSGLILNLCNDARLGTEFVEHLAEGLDVFSTTHKRERNEVDSCCNSVSYILLIFFGQRWKINEHAGQIDVTLSTRVVRVS